MRVLVIALAGKIANEESPLENGRGLHIAPPQTFRIEVSIWLFGYFRGRVGGRPKT